MAEILIGRTEKGLDKGLDLKMANRHGLIAGATGTGKTVSLQRIAEQFSQQGVPVFTADVKGDLAGISQSSAQQSGKGCPVVLWDILGEQGTPLRAALADVGPVLLGRFLNSNEVQQGIINAAFSYAVKESLLFFDLRDFRTL